VSLSTILQARRRACHGRMAGISCRVLLGLRNGRFERQKLVASPHPTFPFFLALGTWILCIGWFWALTLCLRKIRMVLVD